MSNTGKELDDEYGFDLYYYGARYMDPASGRFIAPDPVKDFYNPYSYAHNNPMSRIDPTGMWSPPIHQYGSCTGYEFLNMLDPFSWIDDDSPEYLSHKANQMDVESWRNEILAKERQNATKSSDEAIKNDKGPAEPYDLDFIGPVPRPDEDGYITWKEAVYWYHMGNGEPLSADLSKLHLESIVNVSEFEGIGEKLGISLINRLGVWDEALVYNQTILTLIKGQYVTASRDEFNFEMHEVKGTWLESRNIEIRNYLTSLGQIAAGLGGIPFYIYFEGYGRVGANDPPYLGPWE